MKKLDKVLLSAAVAGMLGVMASGSARADDKMMMKKDASKDVQCTGTNACKGKSSCSGAKSSCAGQNGCKGQGWVKMSKDACDQVGGTSKDLPKQN